MHQGSALLDPGFPLDVVLESLALFPYISHDKPANNTAIVKTTTIGSHHCKNLGLTCKDWPSLVALKNSVPKIEETVATGRNRKANAERPLMVWLSLFVIELTTNELRLSRID